MSSKFNDFLMEQLQDAEFQKEFEALHSEHKNLITQIGWDNRYPSQTINKV